MGRVRIQPLDRLSHRDLVGLAGGYVSESRYRVTLSETRERIRFTLTRTRAATRFVKEFPHPKEETARYRTVVRLGWSLGAYRGDEMIGLLLAEPRSWNRSVWVWELGVAAAERRRGVGRRLIEGLARHAKAEGYRTLVCETQTTNAPAIDFYRAAGFRLQGVDVSHYSNADLERGEVAIFMKRPIPPRGTAGRDRPRRPRHTSE